MVPETRAVAKKYTDLSFGNIKKLLHSKFHKERLAALLILVERFKKSDKSIQLLIYDFYLKNAKNVNNWDLVDLTAPNIVGEHILQNPKKVKILYQLAKSKNLWEKRISIIASFAFIRKNEFNDALKISKILLKDEHRPDP